MSDGITLHCPRCGKYTASHKEYDTYQNIDVYTCQNKECGRAFAIELVIKKRLVK
jgi:transcription elongation factor Elf1